MCIARTLIALCFLGLSLCVSAADFEEVGTVQEVQPEHHLLIVDGNSYELPNVVLHEGVPAIFQLKPGQLVSFSGQNLAPRPIIESLYIINTEPALEGQP